VLPNLIVIGAQKAGTSSLHNYLSVHPEVSMSKPKELDFFSGPGWNWERGLDWYSSHFTEEAPVRGESSPSYSAYPYVKGAPERMVAVVPEARLVYMVRDPIERIVSAYVHRRALGEEERPITQVVSDWRFVGTGYVAQSRYHAQLVRYLQHYDLSRVLVVDQVDLLRRRGETLRRVFRFLGVDEGFDSPVFSVLRNPSSERLAGGGMIRRSRALLRAAGGRPGRTLDAVLARAGRRPALEDGQRRALYERLFEEDVARLRELTGQRFESWGR
jgi:hypothetical protein